MVKVKCPCGVQLQLEDQWAGKRGKCPRCGAMLDIPAAGQEAVTPPAATPPPPIAPVPAAPPTPAEDDPFAPPPVATAAAGRSTPSVAPPHEAAPPRSNDSEETEPNWLSREVRFGKRTFPLVGLVAGAGGAVVVLLVIVIVGSQLGKPSPVATTTTGEELEQTAHAGQVPRPGNATQQPNAPQTPGVNPEEVGPLQPIEVPPEIPPQSNTPAESPVAAVDPGSQATAELAPQAETNNRGNGTFGLSGVSGKYDDRHCQTIQSQFGIRVPAAATVIEVNGWQLPLENMAGLQESAAPYLMLPRGTHAVRWRPGELAIEVEIHADHSQTYGDMRAYFAVESQVKTGELRTRGARALDVHSAPYLLNFTGAAYAKGQKWAAAQRAFRRSLRVNPCYSPAHLNLAHCLQREGNLAAAQRELNLAEMFNVGNVFGLNKAIVDLRRTLAAADSPASLGPSTRLTRFLPEVYVSSQSRSAEDLRLEALMQGISKYAVRPSERGKILNNLAIHYSSSGRTELALEHFRAALAAVRQAGPERFAVARTIFANMQAACEATGFEEAADYAFMQQAVRP